MGIMCLLDGLNYKACRRILVIANSALFTSKN